MSILMLGLKQDVAYSAICSEVIVSNERLCVYKALIVRPASSGQLSVGTRVCAYWSEKFSCLHPGKICEPSSDDDDDDDDDDELSLIHI